MVGYIPTTPFLFFKNRRNDSIINYQQIVKVNLTHMNREWFRDSGHDIEKKSFLEIPAHQLQNNSNMKVKLTCDYCQKEILQPYQSVVQRKTDDINKKDCCKKCEPFKRIERSLSNYHVKNSDRVIEYMILNSFKSIKAVYSIKNIYNNKIYIGSSKKLLRRFAFHFDSLRDGNHHSKEMMDDYIFYNGKVFECDILELVVDENELISKEQYYVDLFIENNILLYNNRTLNVSTNIGIKMPESHRIKTSERQIGKKMSEEQKSKISKSLMGKIVSEETKEKMRKSKKVIL